MTQRRPNADRTGDQPPDPTAVTIADAADRLGITSEAVRMRLKRGTLAGDKRSGHWVVYLPQPTQQDRGADHTPPERATERDQTDVVAVYEALVTAQREEIAFLRRELETRTDELQRRDVLLREALEVARIPRLSAGEDQRSGATAGQGEAIAEQRNRDTPRSAPGPHRRSWWRWVLGID